MTLINMGILFVLMKNKTHSVYTLTLYFACKIQLLHHVRSLFPARTEPVVMTNFYQKLVILVFYCVYGISNSSHQKWWRKPHCHCSIPGGTESTPTGKPIRDVVKSMFPGLLLNSNDLTRLPVMKPEGTRRHGEASYVGNTIPNAGTAHDSCCQT